MWNGQLSISYFSVFLTVGQGEAAACKTTVTTHTSPVPQGNIPTQPPFEGCRPSADSANSGPDYVPLPQEVPEDRTPLGPRHTSGTAGAPAHHPGDNGSVAEASQAWQLWLYWDTTLLPPPVRIHCKTPTDFNGDGVSTEATKGLSFSYGRFWAGTVLATCVILLALVGQDTPNDTDGPWSTASTLRNKKLPGMSKAALSSQSGPNHDKGPHNWRHISIAPLSLFLEIGTKVSVCLDQGLPEGLTGSLFNHKKAPAGFV